MPVPTSPVRPVPSTVRLVRTRPSWKATAAAISLLSVLGTSLPNGFPLVAPGVAALIVALSPSQAPGCGRPWTTWAVAYRGNIAAIRTPCAAHAVDQPHRRASLASLAKNPNNTLERRVIAVRMLTLDEASAGTIESILASPDTPRLLRRTLISTQHVGRSPLPLAATARRIAIDGLYDLALLVDADPFSPENDAESAFPRELDALAATMNTPERTIAGALLQARRTSGSFRPSAANVSPADSQDEPNAQPMPTPLDELSALEGLTDHLREEFAAIRFWIMADVGTRAARFLRAAVTHGDGEEFSPPSASIHRVLRGENAAPAVAALALLRLAEASELEAHVVGVGEGFVLNLPGRAVFISPCGARRAAPVRVGQPLTDDEIIQYARRELSAQTLSTGPGPLPKRVALAREILGSDPTSVMGRVLAELPASNIDNVNPADDPIVASWLANQGQTEAARALVTKPTVGHAEAIRIQTLLALGEPVAARPFVPTRCRSAALPWPAK